MGYSNYVGRVGALAVALGVGFAVANSPGTALADETGTQNQDPPPSGTGQNDPVTDAPTNTPPSNDAPGTTTTTSTQTTTTTTTTGTTTVIGGSSSPQVTISSSGGATETQTASASPSSAPPSPDPSPASTPPSTVTSAPPAPPITQAPAPTTPESTPHSAAPQQNSGTPTTAAAVPPPADIKSADHTLGNTVAPQPMTARVFAMTEDEPSTAASTFQAANLNAPQIAAPVAPNPIGALVALPGTLLSLTANLLSAALAPFLAPSPAAPADTPVLWGLLAWVRRQFERTFLNHTPTLAPQQTSLVVDADGKIHGTLGPADPEGDPLTYWTTSDPAHGTVSIDQTNRTWTYTPDAGYRGPDSFTVKVSDEGTFHMHGLLGFLQPDFGDTDTAVVNVNVANQAAVIDSVQLHGAPKGQLLTSPDGKRAYQVTTDSDDADRFELVVVNTATGGVISRQTISGRLIENTGLVLSPDGTHAVLTSKGVGPQTGETNVRILDLTDPTINASDLEPVATVLGIQQHASDLKFSADGKRAYLTSASFIAIHTTDISVFDIGTRELVGEHLLTGDYWSPAELNDDGTRAFVETVDHADSTVHHVTIINGDTGDIVGPPITVAPSDIVFFAGPTLHTVHEYPGSAFTVGLYSAEDGHQLSSIYISGKLAGLKAGPDGTVYYQSLPGPNVIQVTAITAAGETHEISPITGEQTFLREMHFNSDGSLAYLPTTSLQPNGHYQTQLTIIDTSDFSTSSLVVPGEVAYANGGSALVPTEDHTRALLFTSDFDAAGVESLRATVVDLENGSIVGGANTLPADRVQARLSPDGKVAYLVGRLDGTSGDTEQTVISRLDMLTGDTIGSPVIVDGRSPLSLFDESPFHVSTDGTRAFVVTRKDGAQPKTILTVVDLQNSRIVGQPVVADDIPRDLVTNAAGTVAVLRTTDDSKVTVVDSEGRSRTLTVDGFSATDVLFDDDRGRVYLVADVEGDDELIRAHVKIIETTTGQFTTIGDDVVELGSAIGQPVLAANGTRLLFNTSFFDDYNMRIIDTGVAAAVVAPPPAVDPATSPNLITLALNQIQRVFFNQTPTLSPVQHTVVTGPDGTVVGTLGAHDAEADRLAYTVTGAPAHGSVTIDQATGTWTYTRDAGYVGPDSFTVEASDETGFRFHGLAALFTSGGGYTTSATVNVLVATKPVVLDDNADIDLNGAHAIGTTIFSPDGKRAYQLVESPETHREDRHVELVVVDTATGQRTHEISVDGFTVDNQPLVVSRDGKTALLITQVQTGSDSRSTHTELRIIDLTADIDESNFDPIQVSGSQPSADRLTVSADGRRAYLVTNQYGTLDGTGHLTMIDLIERRVLATPEFAGYPSDSIVETPDGERVLAISQTYAGATYGYVVHIYDARTGDELGASDLFARTGAELEKFNLSEDGNYALLEISGTTAADSNTIRVIDTHTGATTVATSRLTDSELVDFAGKGSRLYILSSGDPNVSGDDTVTVLDTRSGTLLTDNAELPGNLRDRAFTDDGSGYFVYRNALADGGSLLTIVGADGAVIRVPLEGSASTGIPGAPMLFNKDQSLAFVTTQISDGTATNDRTLVTVIDTVTKAPIRTLLVAGSPAGHDYAIMSNQDNTAAVLFTDGTGADGSFSMYATVIDLRTGAVVGQQALISDSTRREVQFNAAGDHAYVAVDNEQPDGSTDTVLAVVDTRTGEVRRIDADGTRIASATGKALAVSKDGTTAFLFTAMTGDGTTVATVVDLANFRVVGTTDIDGAASLIELNDAGTLAAIHTTDGAVTIVDAEGRSARSWAPEGTTDDTDVTFSKDGTRAYLSTVVDQSPPGSFYPDYHTIISVVAIGPSGVSVIETLDVGGLANEPVQVSADGSHAVIMTTTDVFGYTHAIYTIDTGTVSTQVV